MIMDGMDGEVSISKYQKQQKLRSTEHIPTSQGQCKCTSCTGFENTNHKKTFRATKIDVDIVAAAEEFAIKEVLRK